MSSKSSKINGLPPAPDKAKAEKAKNEALERELGPGVEEPKPEPVVEGLAEEGPWRVPKGVEVTSLRGLLKAGDEVSPRDFPGKMVVLQDLLSKGKLEVF